MKRKECKTDLFLMLIFPIVAFIISLIFKINSFGSIILFLLIPSIYLSIKGKKYVKKSLIFSLIAGIPIVIILDGIGHLYNFWFIKTIFSFRIFMSPLESILWGILTVYFTIMFYEYFQNKHPQKRIIKPRMKILLKIMLVLFFIFSLSFLFYPLLLNIPYFYAVWGVVFVLAPLIVVLIRSPRLASKYFFAAAYFFYFSLLYEIAAIKLEWWKFLDGSYVGWLNVLGIAMPVEELAFYLLFLAIAIISYYEFFDDDEK